MMTETMPKVAKPQSNWKPNYGLQLLKATRYPSQPVRPGELCFRVTGSLIAGDTVRELRVDPKGRPKEGQFVVQQIPDGRYCVSIHGYAAHGRWVGSVDQEIRSSRHRVGHLSRMAMVHTGESIPEGDLSTLPVTDDCLAPRIKAGGFLLLHRGRRAIAGDMVVAESGGKKFICRTRKAGSRLALDVLAPKTGPKVLPATNARIEAVAIAFQSPV